MLCCLSLPQLLFAHVEGGNGFMAGLTHPVLGLDHLLAMLSVGILSAQIGGRAIWTIPATFVGIMLIGGWMGIGAEALSFVEMAIAISVIVLGAAIAFEKKLPMILTMAFVGFFAFFHGHAHGVEMPSLAHPFMYAGGFLLGTTLIHLVGVLIGSVFTKTPERENYLRFAGAFMAGMGLQILLG